MSTDELVAKIRALADAEIPADDGPGATPGYAITILRESQDFWEDEERDLIDPITLEYEAHRQEVAAGLAEIWGSPDQVELWPILKRSIAGEAVPPLLGDLAQFAVTIDTWQVGGRMVCQGVGHEDKELPIVLFVAVGE